MEMPMEGINLQIFFPWNFATFFPKIPTGIPVSSIGGYGKNMEWPIAIPKEGLVGLPKEILAGQSLPILLLV